MTKTNKKNKKRKKNKTRKKINKTIVHYDKFGNLVLIPQFKYMAIRMADREIKSSCIKKNITQKKKNIIPYLEEEYRNRLKKTLKIKQHLATFNDMQKKKLKKKNVDKYVDKLKIKQTENIYLKLLRKIRPKKK